MKDRKIQNDCEALLADLEGRCNDKINEVSREISQELRFSASFIEDQALRMHKIIDAKRIWDWSTMIAGGGLTISPIIAEPLKEIFPKAVKNVSTKSLVLAGIAVATVGILGSTLFKAREEKIEEARTYLESKLKENVKSICDSLEKQMLKNFSKLIDVRVMSLIKELERIHSVVYRLAGTQRRLAWSLDSHLLSLNKQIIHEAIRLTDTDCSIDSIIEVARIPGNASVFMLKDGTIISEEQKEQLRNLMNETIDFAYDNDGRKTLIANIIGYPITLDQITIEENAGIAHIPMKDVPPYVITRARMAQQFTRLIII